MDKAGLPNYRLELNASDIFGDIHKRTFREQRSQQVDDLVDDYLFKDGVMGLIPTGRTV